MVERYLKFPPGVKRTGRTVCTICGCVIEPTMLTVHLAVCPVVHPVKEK